MICNEEIKERVRMEDAVRFYLPGEEFRYGRIRCPFHGGEHFNCAIYSASFFCFSCKAHGDVISFVEKLMGVEYLEACKMLDRDFRLGLNIGEPVTLAEMVAMDKKLQALKAVRKKENRERMQLEDEYDAALRDFATLDIIITHGDPESSEYTAALRKHPLAKYRFEEAEGRLLEFERGSEARG